ncbi:riboflavin biosynthesis protein [Desulfuromonas versatilis]|uniref:Riboflavin biosynthesis protein n=1 Tax=Desulfuromonas versatilis TaxID=2802975 RepID=A0ABM8HRX8_9BACT|nr:bifunctional riboflavin kinase/FAD synthetase [Desulfuromonas versatilis]BCR04657.1 riboflavin biosynthesis protein [Desulfuromonas versatilis]
MRIIRNLDEITSPFLGAVVTLGNFDGVHLGHREIFRRVVQKAREIGGTSIVYTFDPHPLKVVAPPRAPRLINTSAEKERLIEASCFDVMIAAPFNLEIAAQPAASFVEEILVAKIGVRYLVVGYDYAFGRGREGDAAYLARRGQELGFGVEILKPVSHEGEVYSSTRVRQLIEAGDVTGVVGYLGRHFTMEGTVVHGARRGTTLGFPTANLATDKELLPKPGVYAVKVKLASEIHDGVVNIGFNPTFQGGKMTVEVYIFNFRREIYGENLRLYFVDRLRDEKRFGSPQELVAAIDADIRKAQLVLAATRVIEYREYLDCGYLHDRPGCPAKDHEA